MSLALGIDTGGTYTDAALVEYETGRVLAHAKALTTRHDLAIGIREAMGRVLGAAAGGAPDKGPRPARPECIWPADVRLVSLSTTLATNAIVEDQGAPVAALLIGYGDLFADVNLTEHLGTRRYALIGGGHHADGEEAEPLDLEAARAFIAEQAPHVAGLAVSGYFGTRNPSHELAVKALAREMAESHFIPTDLPVTCGHELTHRLDALRRATTVVLNARLIPLLCDLIRAVEAAMAARGIDAPLMVVKGDGSLMRASVARERPIETILSGPAASVVGARHLAAVTDGNGAPDADSGDAVVVDMGGTTTDIAVLSDGRPRLNPAGARVGRWRTMVEAVDVHTVGLGGDSRVWFDEGRELRVGPRRVVPIALLAATHPEVGDVLRAQADGDGLKRGGDDALGQFLLLQRVEWRHDGEHPPFERALMERLARGPLPLTGIGEIVEHPRLYVRYLEGLERGGIVARAGLTPTDAAHVLGLYRAWDVEAARLAAELAARRAGREVESLCREIVARTGEGIAAAIVAKLVHDDAPSPAARDGRGGGEPSVGAEPSMGALDARLMAWALRPGASATLDCALTLRPSLVAIGAPVSTYFPQVASLLHGRLRIPPYTEVANAVGAVVGSVVCRAHVLIVPRPDEDGYRVHLPGGIADEEALADALALAERRGRALVSEAARRAGAQEITIGVERRDRSAPVAYGWGEEVYLQSTLTITATGRPRLALRE